MSVCIYTLWCYQIGISSNENLTLLQIGQSEKLNQKLTNINERIMPLLYNQRVY